MVGQGIDRDGPVITAPSADIRVVVRPGMATKVRRFIRLSGFASSAPVYVHNNSLHNVLVGLNERVFGVSDGSGGLKDPPKPHAGAFNKLQPYRAGIFRKLGCCTPWTMDQFLGTYTGSKRLRMERAAEVVATNPLTKRGAMLKAFVKAESVFKLSAAPRMIQPRSPEYNVTVGPYLKALEHRVYGAIAGYRKHPCVMKGYNATGTAKVIVDFWRSFQRPVAVGIDMSRFDQHVSVEALLFEHSIYYGAYPQHRKKLAKWLNWQIFNDGVALTPEGKVRYHVRGKRMSGDMNTALGNCILMCGMVDAWLRETEIDAKFVDNGDDVVVILEENDLPRFMRGMEGFFLGFGFTAVVEEPVRVLEQIRFCQCAPIFDGVEWTMVREPSKAMLKDSLCKSPSLGANSLAATLKWAAAVGTAGLALAGGIPIFQASYSRMLSLGQVGGRVQGFGDMSTGFEYMARGMARSSRSISAEARYSFFLAFGILPDEQEAIEAFVSEAATPECLRTMISSGDSLGIDPSIFT